VAHGKQGRTKTREKETEAEEAHASSPYSNPSTGGSRSSTETVESGFISSRVTLIYDPGTTFLVIPRKQIAQPGFNGRVVLRRCEWSR